MSKEKDLNITENKEAVIHKQTKSQSHQTMGMSLGMCIGISIGMSMGYLLFDNGSLGMCIGLSVGMCIGMAIGHAKDSEINKQIEEKGYRISEINQIDIETFEVKITSKDDNEHRVMIGKGEMDTEDFQIGDYVYMDEDGEIEKVLDEE